MADYRRINGYVIKKLLEERINKIKQMGKVDEEGRQNEKNIKI
ncbi:MAG: hypothetical protein ABSF13_03725 [Smithella sp.]|jgi:hypothetical protein